MYILSLKQLWVLFPQIEEKGRGREGGREEEADGGIYIKETTCVFPTWCFSAGYPSRRL